MLKSTVAELSADERATWEEITSETIEEKHVKAIDRLFNGNGFTYTAVALQALAAWYEANDAGESVEAGLIRELAAKLAIIEAQTV